jgi:hypothetical protein
VSASKDKGTAAETAVVRFLRANGYPHCERRALAGAQDRGDVAGIPGLVVEVKAVARMELAGWLDEASSESVTARNRVDGSIALADVPVVWHKRRGKRSPGDWYVTMDGWAFLALLKEWTDDAS